MDAPPRSADLLNHVELLCSSYRRFTGRSLIEDGESQRDAFTAVWDAPYVIASHDTRLDPIFNFGNLAALALFEMTWEQFKSLPSRKSAEPVLQSERTRLLDRVNRDGFIDDYSGVRISATGRRFLIRDATVWTVLDARNQSHGQAVVFKSWSFV